MIRARLAILVAPWFMFSTTPVSAEALGAYAGYQGGRYSISKFRTKDRQMAHGPYVGYRFQKYLAGEVQYLLQRKTSDRVTYKGQVAVAFIRPILPINDYWEVYAKVGWAWVDGDFNTTGRSPEGAQPESRNYDGGIFGVGSGWNIGRFNMRVEYQFGSTDNGRVLSDLAFYTVGVGVKF